MAKCPIRVLAVAGARPNFMKIAPLLKELRAREGFETVLVHTGQHYDAAMSDSFFRDLGIPEPDVNLGVGSGSHGEQTAEVLRKIESLLIERHPDVLVVVGDVNSTLAATLAAVKLGIPVAHVEAGLRSFDRGMPEETNRVMTDVVSEWLFTTEAVAEQNLLREGVARDRIHFVGNVMIDTLLANLDRARGLASLERLGLRISISKVARSNKLAKNTGNWSSNSMRILHPLFQFDFVLRILSDVPPDPIYRLRERGAL